MSTCQDKQIRLSEILDAGNVSQRFTLLKPSSPWNHQLAGDHPVSQIDNRDQDEVNPIETGQWRGTNANGISKGSWDYGEREAGALLWRRVLDKIDPLFDVGLQSLGAGFQEIYFLFGYVSQDVDSLFRTRCSKFHRH